MKRAEWKELIVKNCEEAGTYENFFVPVIDTLSTILERRDDAEELFAQTGSKVIVKHTNKAGAQNIEQNPVLRMINDLNRDALTYWRDLGLTPSGYKKLNADVVKKNTSNSLEKLLEKII